MSLTDEPKLVERATRGDQHALGDLLRHYQTRLYNVCLRMVSNRDDAAEATQEAMLKIVKNIENFQGNAAISTWMTRVAMNESISLLRKRKVRKAASLEGGNGRQVDDQASALRKQLVDEREPTPDQRVQMGEMRSHLQDALAALDEQFRSILVLRDIDGLDYQQVADTLEVPVGTVKSRLFRARLALREQMQQWYPSAGEREAAEA